MIRFEEVTKTYGDVVAVDALDLLVEDGELFVFLGPNGAGKTTSIKMCATLLLPTAGRVLVDGMDAVGDSLEVRGAIGYLPENPFLYEGLSARQMLSFAGEARSLDPARLKRRADELLALLELEEAADQQIRGYSHGMRKKVAIATALLHDPHVLLFDEPTSGLDPRSARVVKDLLLGLRDRGTTVFLSTHILEVAERMCDRVGIIQDGRLIAAGSMEDLRAGRDASLEEIFLELTGGAEVAELAQYLDDTPDAGGPTN
jgi:ABC-2 type transport system ATP-binding protein